ncbi:hypothetical protein BLNAU_16815 [Blattamonas nauphoetae]|uniref:TOG domain-containing protein n=1 Tax=Blattamonas nauphoetae TaxID=2049346 RepID=A0ABQ9XBN7_9EUKA|nr:hypothetical protein BLNAU_16815 [Blattamonas nauphoetae]
MLSNPDSSSTIIPTTDRSVIKPNEEKEELFEKIRKLETESKEIRVEIAKELVNLCLNDSGNKKGVGIALMEGRILPILGHQLGLRLCVEVRVVFQVLFDAVLALISNDETGSLSKHFPSLLALSQNSDNRISEPVIATIGLITHRLSSPPEMELFLQSGILESLVSSVRTHPNAHVRRAIVVALGEIGVGLKLAVVREEATKRRKTGKSSPSPTPSKNSEETEIDEHQMERSSHDQPSGSFADPLSCVSLSAWEVRALGSVKWAREDKGGTDFVSRCLRGIGIVREGLTKVVRGWGEEEEEKSQKKRENEDGEEEGEEWNGEEDVGVRQVAGSVCGVVFGEVFGVKSSWCRSGVVGVRGSDVEEIRAELSKKMEEQREALESRLESTLQTLEEERKQNKQKEHSPIINGLASSRVCLSSFLSSPASLSFCPACKMMLKCRKGQSQTTHGSVAFKTGDEVELEVDMESRTCHFFVNNVQTKVFTRGIPASIKLAISFYGTNDAFSPLTKLEEEAKGVIVEMIAVCFQVNQR